MTKQFVVGKQYKLVDASKDEPTKYVTETGKLTFPANSTFTCHKVDDDGDCFSHTTGVAWHDAYSKGAADVMCATIDGLEAGAFVEVTDA